MKGKKVIKNEAPTRDKIVPILEDIKDLIKSTAKGTETALREEFSTGLGKLEKRMETVEYAVTEHSKMIKDLKVEVQGVRTELKDEIQGVRTELKDEIQGVRTELKGEIQGLRTELKDEIQGVRTELKGEIQGLCTELKDEMHQMENRLSKKIDGNSARLDDHEVRISSFETSRL
jgi:gas vesicle protein